MDVMVTAGVALVIAVIAALIALIKKRNIWRILIYGFAGLIIGLIIGHILTPTILSFV